MERSTIIVFRQPLGKGSAREPRPDNIYVGTFHKGIRRKTEAFRKRMNLIITWLLFRYDKWSVA